MEDTYDSDAWPTDAWCPKCGLALVCIKENFYYCARCDKNFELKEIMMEEETTQTEEVSEAVEETPEEKTTEEQPEESSEEESETEEDDSDEE